VNSTWLITSKLANQHVKKELFTCVVYTKNYYFYYYYYFPLISDQFHRLSTTLHNSILLTEAAKFSLLYIIIYTLCQL